MANHTRRDVLRGAGALAAGLTSPGAVLGAGQAAGTERRAPELIVHNAHVYTMDEAQPQAEAFAGGDGRFTAIGRSVDVLNLKGVRTEVIDGQGRVVLPGFIDAHTHPAWGGVEELIAVNCDLRSLAAIKDADPRRAPPRRRPGSGSSASRYDDTKVVGKAGLTAKILTRRRPTIRS